MSSLNLVSHAVIDEIGLEGLDGITLESETRHLCYLRVDRNL